MAVTLLKGGDSAFEAAFDAALDEKEYCRALLAPDDLAQLKAEVAKDGYMTIEQVREAVVQNTVKESMEARGETYAIDPELMIMIDVRINYRIFVAGDNVFTRDELMAHYPFEDFGVTPEQVFAQQEVGIFPPKKYAMVKGENEYVARDVGDPEEFIMIEDLVGRAARKNYEMTRAPTQIVKTKIFIGKDNWEDFSTMQRFVRSFQKFVCPQLTGGAAVRAIASAATRNYLAIQDAEGASRLDAQRRAAEDRALAAKVADLKRQEEELRQREIELYRSLGLEPPSGGAEITGDSPVVEDGGGDGDGGDDDIPDDAIAI